MYLRLAEKKPPFQALTFLDHALKLLTRQVEEGVLQGKKVHGKCAHGFSDEEHHGRHCLVGATPTHSARVFPLEYWAKHFFAQCYVGSRRTRTARSLDGRFVLERYLYVNNPEGSNARRGLVFQWMELTCSPSDVFS